MDFGLASEVAERGQTDDGRVAADARLHRLRSRPIGDVRAAGPPLRMCTALGATLYDVDRRAARPFVSDAPVEAS